ncbi:MAG TPA: hypothetical protein VMC43_03045 [Candidatus Paceibacterota bacterium]|nr:hypothetical protein [Candidatus Paceibacterota bacterium]
MAMDALRQRVVFLELLVSYFRAKMEACDPVNQVTLETIREELAMLARQTREGISEEEVRETAALIWNHLKMTPDQFLKMFGRLPRGA